MVEIRTYNYNLTERFKRRFKQLRLYCITSVASGALMFLLLFIFTSLIGYHYLISLTISFILTTTASFVFNKIFVFKTFNPKKLTQQYYEFFIVSISVYVVNFIFLFILVDLFNMWYLLAQFLISIVGLPILYMVHRKLVFSHPRNFKFLETIKNR